MLTPGNFLVVSSNPTNVGRGRLLLQGQDVIVNIPNKKELDLSEDSVGLLLRVALLIALVSFVFRNNGAL